MAANENEIHTPPILGKQDPMIALDFAEQLMQIGQSTLAQLYLNIMLNQTGFRQTGRTLSKLTGNQLEAELLPNRDPESENIEAQTTLETRIDRNDPPKNP